MSPNKFDYEKEIGALIAGDLDSCCNLEFETIWNLNAKIEYWNPLGFDCRVERIENEAKRLKWLQISLNGYPCYLLERYDRHDDAAYHFKSYTWEPRDIYDPNENSYQAHRVRFDVLLTWIKEDNFTPDFCVLRRKHEAGPVMYSMRSVLGNFTLAQGFASVAALRHCFENVVRPRFDKRSNSVD